MSGIFDQIINYSPPLIVSGTVNYKGTWNASTNTPTLIDPPVASTKGDYYVVSTAGTQFSITFGVGDWIISNGTAWEKVDLTDAVSSVFGRTGAVVGVSTDYSAVGLTNTAIGASSPSTGAFTSLSSSSTTTLNGTTIPASKTLVVTTDKLSALAATTSAELASVISNETGSGALVFATSPTLVTPILGTPQSGTLTSCTGLPISTGVSGLGTGIATALAVNSGSTGAPALLGSAGAFTTLSATGAINSANAFVSTSAVTANAADRVTLDFGGGTFGRVLAWGPNNSTAGQLDLGVLSANASVGSTSIARVSATGVAVTGALSATGNITSTASTPFIVGSSATTGIIYYGSTGAASPVKTLVNNVVVTDVTTGGLAVTGALSATGVISTANLGMLGNQINETLTNGNASIAINYSGYNLGTTQFRDLNIFDGKNNLAASFAGSTKSLLVMGNVVAFGDSANGNSAFESTFSGTTRNGLDLADSTDTSGVFFGVFRKASGVAIGSITRVTTTDAVVYNTTSDGRLKENLRDFTDSGRLIDSLKPRVFDWKNSDENGKNVVGFIAQEENAADPIFAHIGAVSVGDEDPETITKQWQRSDSALIPILVAELKSVRARLAALEAK
jgi:hypothetical protein